MADTPDVQEDDIADVDLTQAADVPAEQPEDKPSETDKETPEDGADAEDKPEEKAAKDDKDSPAKDAKAEEDKPEADKAEGDDPDKPEEEAAAEESPEDRQQRAQQEWRKRQRTRQQVEQQIDQAYAPKTQDQLVEEGMKPEQANVEAIRQEIAFKEERTRIAELNAGMQADAVNVMKDFPVFDKDAKGHDPEFTKLVEDQYKVAARIQADENGIVTNAEVSLYDFYQKMADIYGRGTSKGSAQGQADMQKMMSRTENPGGSSSTQAPSGDDLEAMEERLKDVRLA